MKKTKYANNYFALLVALATFIIYLAALRNDFVLWDDGDYIIKNSHIRSLNWGLLKWAFFDFYAANWHPLTWISHAVDYAVWGLNPLGHHLMNIIIHAVNTFLVIVLIAKLLQVLKQATLKKTRLWDFLSERTILIAAGVAGLLFGLHPLHVESVAWVAERKDLLCAFFFLLSIIMYTAYVKGIGDTIGQMRPVSYFPNRHYFFTFVFFVLALLSKPMAVTLPVVLLILDWYPFQRIQSLKTFTPTLVEKIPFFALSLISSVLTILAQGAGRTLASLETIPLSVRVFGAAKALIAYLWNMMWPLDLIPFYQHYPKGVSFGLLEYLAPIVFVIGLTVASVAVAKRQKLWLTVWGYYVVTLIPVLGIVQVGRQLMADRYTYLPSLGPFLLVGLFAALIVEKANAGEKRQPVIRIISVAIAIIAAASFSYLTIKQIAVWKNTITLWSRVIEKEPSTLAAYKERGRAFDEKGQLEKAIQDFDAAIALSPGDYEIYYDRGSAFHKMGKLDKAREDYDMAITLKPLYSGTYNNRGVLYITTGVFQKAIEDFNVSITMNPQRADVYNNRGFAYFSIRQYGKAQEDYDMAVRLDQNYAAAYFNRGNLHSKIGRRALAHADFQKACALGDDDGCKALY